MVLCKAKIRKSIVLLTILLLCFSGCEKQIEDNEYLSDNELEIFLKKNNDFISFIKEKQMINDKFYLNIEDLKDSKIKQLKAVYEKHDNYTDFISNAQNSDLQLFKTLLPSKDNKEQHLRGLMLTLNKFNYNKRKLVQIISSELIVSKRNYNNRISVNCEDVYWDVYISQLNSLYNGGMDLETADIHGEIAGSWALVGCIMGQQ